MITEEVIVTLIRFYPVPIETEYDKYTAACTLLYETPKIVWIKGLTGTVTRQVLRQLMHHLIEKGVTLLKAYRAGSRLPYSTKIDGHYCEIDLTIMGERIIQDLRI